MTGIALRNIASPNAVRLLGLVLCAFMSILLALPAQAQDRDPIALEAIAPDALVAGEVIVQFQPGTSEAAKDRGLALVQGSFVRTLDSADLILAKVPVGTEIAAAESLRIDPIVVGAQAGTVLQVEEPLIVP